jgi:4-amino-4-deoxy-L-arabinose transferase-like glycosyltransferase
MTKNKFSRLIPIFLSAIFITLLYFASRIQNLVTIPVFGDEAIYIRWSQIIKSVDSLRFVPLSDGKQPLFMWITVVFFKFINDPLIASRLLSVISGYFTLVAISLTLAILINFKSASKNPLEFITQSISKNYKYSIFIALIYIFSPYSFFFDRLALPDSLLSTLVSISLFFLILITKFPRLDLSIILGTFLGLAWLTKSPALYFVVISSVWLLINSFKNKFNLFYSALSATIAFVIYNILRLGPQFHQIALRNQDYVWGLSDILNHPFDPLKSHFLAVLKIWSAYLSWAIIILPLIALIIYLVKSKKQFILSNPLFLLIIWFISPLLVTITFVKTFTARYILFSLPSLLIIFSYVFYYFIKRSTKKPLLIGLIILLQIPSLIFIHQISTKPESVTLPPTEVGYLQDWTSGWGIKPVSEYLIKRSSFVNVIVGTEGYFGTLPDGLQIYTNQVLQLTVFGVGLDFTTIPEKLIDAHQYGDEVYLLINQSRNKLLPQELAKLKVIQKHPKPAGDNLILYQLI